MGNVGKFRVFLSFWSGFRVFSVNFGKFRVFLNLKISRNFPKFPKISPKKHSKCLKMIPLYHLWLFLNTTNRPQKQQEKDKDTLSRFFRTRVTSTAKSSAPVRLDRSAIPQTGGNIIQKYPTNNVKIVKIRTADRSVLKPSESPTGRFSCTATSKRLFLTKHLFTKCGTLQNLGYCRYLRLPYLVRSGFFRSKYSS